MDILEVHQKVQQVESGLKLALLVVGGIAGAIALVAFIGAAATEKALKEEQRTRGSLPE
jgi:hypothetical protein